MWTLHLEIVQRVTVIIFTRYLTSALSLRKVLGGHIAHANIISMLVANKILLLWWIVNQNILVFCVCKLYTYSQCVKLASRIHNFLSAYGKPPVTTETTSIQSVNMSNCIHVKSIREYPFLNYGIVAVLYMWTLHLEFVQRVTVIVSSHFTSHLLCHYVGGYIAYANIVSMLTTLYINS